MKIDKNSVAKMVVAGEAAAKREISQMSLAELGNIVFLLKSQMRTQVVNILLAHAEKLQAEKKKLNEERKKEKEWRHQQAAKDKKRKSILA